MSAAIAAEIRKLVTLPAAAWSVTLTAVLTGVTGAALASGGATLGGETVPGVVTRAATFAQVGVIIGAVLPMTQEYGSGQIRASLRAVPNRGRLLTAKAAVTVAWVVALAVVATVAGASGAALAGVAEARAGLTGAGWMQLGLVGAYLVIIGLTAAEVALAVRGYVPAVATSMVAVLIVSPTLAGLTDLARWLPDRAAAALLGGQEGLADVARSAGVALGWLVVLAAAGALAFSRRDA